MPVYGPPDPLEISDGGGGGGHGYGSGGGGGGFFPGGGQAQPFGGFGQGSSFAPGMMRRRKMQGGSGRMAFSGGMGGGMGGGGGFAASQPRPEGGVTMPGSGGSPPSLPGGWGGRLGAPGFQPQQPGSQGPFPGGSWRDPATGQLDPRWWIEAPKTSPWDMVNNLVSGAGFGGAYGLNPPEAIMNSIRQQAVSDAGARERSARLGLQSQGDTDPSTYGFQALMSQLQGQDQTSRTMSQADLALRQQQLAFVQQMLGQSLGNYQSGSNAYISRPQDQSPWGPILGGLGQLGGAAIGAGGWGGLFR